MKNLFNRFFAFMSSLAVEGGPSSTRWIYMRTSEIYWLGWLSVVFAGIYRFIRFGDANGGWMTLTGTMAAAGFAFAQQAQTTKMSLDTKPGVSATNTPLSSQIEQEKSV